MKFEMLVNASDQNSFHFSIEMCFIIYEGFDTLLHESKQKNHRTARFPLKTREDPPRLNLKGLEEAKTDMG